MKLIEKDHKLIKEIQHTFERLFLPSVNEVAAALRTASDEVLVPIAHFCSLTSSISLKILGSG